MGRSYNSRLQPLRSWAQLPSSAYVLDFNFDYGAQNNGNIWKVTNNRAPLRSANYRNDNLNRISEAWSDGDSTSAPATCWAEQFNIDPWGNMKIVPHTIRPGCLSESFQPPFDTNNRISYAPYYGYDAAGNMTTFTPASTPVTLAYDAENRLTSFAGGAANGGADYTYDTDGRRIKKALTGSATTYWYGPSGEVLAEGDAAGAIQREFIYFGGRRIARRTLAGNAVHYFLSDHLGSSNVVADATGNIAEESDFLPYGHERTIVNALADQQYKFTGKERDTESNLDYFGARYYGSSMGRFISADEFTGGPIQAWGVDPRPPGPLPYAEITNPQSLNKYVYTYNNPLKYIDPDGHFTSPVHTWITNEAAKKLGYSVATQKLLVKANLQVDRPSNFLNNKEHGMSDAFTTNDKARQAIEKTIEGKLTGAVKAAASGDVAKAISQLGQGLHTVQDYKAHGGATLLGHGGESSNDNNPEKVRDALSESDKFLQQFEEKLTKAVGEAKAGEILGMIKKLGDEK